MKSTNPYPHYYTDEANGLKRTNPQWAAWQHGYRTAMRDLRHLLAQSLKILEETQKTT